MRKTRKVRCNCNVVVLPVLAGLVVYLSRFCSPPHHTYHVASATPAMVEEAQEPEMTGCPDIASFLFNHWKNQTKLHKRRLATTSRHDTPSLLKRMGLLSTSEYCYCKFEYDGTSFRAIDDLSRHCNGTTNRPQLTLRSQIYARLFNRLVEKRRLEMSKFEFYLDLTSGTRKNVGLFEKLKLPVFSFSRNPQDRYSFPLPDAHMIGGVFGDASPYDFHIAFPGFPEGMSKIYKGYASTWDFKWEDKTPKAVFRGGCHPTFASDNIYPTTRNQLRSDFCMQYKDASNDLFDIGIHLQTPPCSVLPDLDLCKQCAPCDGRPRLSPVEQAGYKYQLIIDGHAAANDGTAWKLLTKSACILVRPNDWDTPIFEQFYYPLLVPYKHYIPASLDEIEAAIDWCESHDSQCRKIGEAASRLAKCIFDRKVLEDYVYEALRYAHDSAVGTEPGI